MYAQSVRKAMQGEATTGVILRELLPVDRIMQRWAAANGEGLPSEVWDDSPRARPPPLDDDTAMVVDRIVLSLPPKTHRIVNKWYRKPIPTRLIAEQIGCSPRSLEKQWTIALNFLRWKFVESRNVTLLRLLRVRG